MIKVISLDFYVEHHQQLKSVYQENMFVMGMMIVVITLMKIQKSLSVVSELVNTYIEIFHVEHFEYFQNITQFIET